MNRRHDEAQRRGTAPLLRYGVLPNIVRDLGKTPPEQLKPWSLNGVHANVSAARNRTVSTRSLASLRDDTAPDVRAVPQRGMAGLAELDGLGLFETVRSIVIMVIGTINHSRPMTNA